jgi:putative ABC transport system permease protein
MLKSYFIIAWRNILKNSGLFAINTIGLSLGIAACLTIALFVLDELSYDRYNEKADRIVRVVLNAKIGDEIIEESGVMAPVAGTMEREYAEVVTATRVLYESDRTKVTYEGETIRQGKLAFVDSNFFDVFTLPLIKGDARDALSRPGTVVLTREQAEAYFGTEDPLNKTIKIDDIGVFGTMGYTDASGLYTVTGIVDKFPDNSHMHFDLLVSMASNKDATNESWLSGSYHTYLLMREGTDIAQFESKLPEMTKKYMSSQLEVGLGMTFDRFLEIGNKVGLQLQPLSKIHLHSDLTGEFEQGGNIDTVYIFSAIALFMLLIACINFMNLSTAGASKRIKEIGMRKVLGSGKIQLIIQFLTEAFFCVVFAMGLGVLIFYLSLPYFNNLAGKHFIFGQILNPQFLWILLLLTIVISLLAGGYPAFFMSGFKPLQALRNIFSSANSKGIRSGLVVFQFAISAVLIIASLVVSQQIDYIQTRDLGYNREGLMLIRDAGFLGKNLDAFKSELARDPRVLHITKSAFSPAGPTDNSQSMFSSSGKAEQKRRGYLYNIDEEYIATLGMELLEGRNFSIEFGNEEDNIIINQTAVRIYGLGSDAVGKTLIEATDNQGGTKILRIIGVIRDFNTRSLHEPIEPIIMKYNPYYGLILRAKTADMPGLISSIEKHWENFGPSETFDYAFLDELYNETYLKEYNIHSILRIFAFLTIFVACLGLLGLVAYTTQQRFKEIGIRKVLGSSVAGIIGLLAKEFLKWIVISMVIAFPVGFWLMDKWLRDFAYHVDIKWWVFVLAGVSTLIIALITICIRSINVALMNPVDSLRTE